MQKSYKHQILLIILIFTAVCLPVTLKEIFDAAGPEGEYDKVLNLEKGKIYTGGLSLGYCYNPITFQFDSLADESVKINGNGAIIDLKNSHIHIAYTDKILDIDSCVIANGTVRYTGKPDAAGYIIPHGSISNVTFYKPVDFGIRMEGSGENMHIYKNLVSECITTGGDFPQYDSFPAEMLRTGTSFAFSAFSWYGFPGIFENWSYNSSFPGEPLANFSML